MIDAATTGSTTDDVTAISDLSIRPFEVDVPQDALDDLRRRVAAMRWPTRETVDDRTQGVQLAMMEALARYWATDYDWRKVEARLQALPHFITEIDGVDIHFIHVRSQHEGALPVIITHGWPGSIIEQLKIIGPLTDPTAHGASADDAFDVVIPSLPGHGFSGTPTVTGWDPIRIARAWAVLMERLGYTRYVAQGGDWGNAVTEQMAAVLGEQARLLRAEGRRAADRGQRLPRRDLRRPVTLGGAGLPEPGPLQPPPEGWPLRRVGAAGALLRGVARDVQVPPIRVPE